MYPSFNNHEDTNLFTFSENIYANPNSTIHENLSSSSSLFSYFPCSPLTYGEEAMFFQQFNDILHQKNIDDQEMVNHDVNITKFSDDKCCSKNMSNVNKVKLSSRENHHQEIREKLGRCKKDKHSKIMTANGSSRGRRMRLSIDVAKEFFGLQDMLGFDKASKTVEWLLDKSKNAIKEMKHSSSTPSSTSVLSAVDEIEVEVATKLDKTKEGKGVRKLAVFHPLARESREKARARARERTLEKKRLQLIGGNCTQQMNLGSSNPFLSGEKSNTGINFHNINTSTYSASLLEVEKLPQKIGDSFFITNTWNSSSTIFNRQNNSGTTSNIEHQFASFQYDGKPWDGFL